MENNDGDYWLCSSSESEEAVTETMSQQESFVQLRPGHTTPNTPNTAQILLYSKQTQRMHKYSTNTHQECTKAPNTPKHKTTPHQIQHRYDYIWNKHKKCTKHAKYSTNTIMFEINTKNAPNTANTAQILSYLK